MCRIFRGNAVIGMLILACSLLHTARAGETLDRIERTGKVVLGSRESSLPFSYVSSSAYPIGYTMDICSRLVVAIKRHLKRNDIETDYKVATPSTRFSFLVEGKTDLDCGPNTNTAERRRRVEFTIPHFIATARMLVRKDAGIRRWSDLRGKAIVTTKATTNARTLAARSNVRSLNISTIEAGDDNQSFRLVETHAAEAFAMDDVLLFGLRANSKSPADYSIVGEPLSVEPYAIAFSRHDSELKKVIDSEMARMIHSGEIYMLYAKWFNSPIPPHGANLAMPMNPILRSSFQFPPDKVGDEIVDGATKNR